MQERIILLRFLAVPRRHQLVAAGIAVAAGIGCFAWSRHTAPSPATKALLSFNAEAARPMQPGVAQVSVKEPAAALAQSILSDTVLNKLASQVGIPSSGHNDAQWFRSHLELVQPAPGLLRVQYRDADSGLAVAASNAVANSLVAWMPSIPAAPPAAAAVPQGAPVAARGTRHSRSPSLSHRRSNSLRELEAQLTATNAKLAALNAVPSASAQPKSDAAPPAPNPAGDQRRALELQLSAAQKRLDELHVRYTDAYPDVEDTKDDIAQLRQKLAALPPPAMQPHPPQQTDARPAPRSSGNEAAHLRRQRDRLLEKISVEKRSEATPLVQSTDRPTAAQAASSQQDLPAPSETRVLRNPFALVHLAVDATPPRFAGAIVGLDLLAGILSGLLYLFGIISRQLQPSGSLSAAGGTPIAGGALPEDSPTPPEEDRSDQGARKSLSLTIFGGEEEALPVRHRAPEANGQEPARGGRLELSGQVPCDEPFPVVSDAGRKNPVQWVAHPEEARSTRARHDAETAVSEIKLTFTASPEELKTQLSRIAMQMNIQRDDRFGD